MKISDLGRFLLKFEKENIAVSTLMVEGGEAEYVHSVRKGREEGLLPLIDPEVGRIIEGNISSLESIPESYFAQGIRTVYICRSWYLFGRLISQKKRVETNFY